MVVSAYYNPSTWETRQEDPEASLGYIMNSRIQGQFELRNETLFQKKNVKLLNSATWGGTNSKQQQQNNSHLYFFILAMKKIQKKMKNFYL
jgi:hypothetical protein